MFRLAVALGALLSPAAAQARAKAPTVTVMTRNLFLGADLAPAINAPTIPRRSTARDGLERAAGDQVRRARGAARARDQGVQGGPRRAAGGRAVAQADAVRRRRQADQPAGERHPRDRGRAGLPRAPARAARARATRSSSSRRSSTPSCRSTPTTTTRPAPARWPRFGADFDARLTMRDVILVAQGQQGEARQDARRPLQDPLRAERRRHQDPGRPRLDVGRGARRSSASSASSTPTSRRSAIPKIREAQAKELTKGPLKTSEQVILVGDLNSGDAKDNEPEKPGDELAFAALTKFGMKNNGARQSCCYENLFDPALLFDHTVDHVLSQAGPGDGQGVDHRQDGRAHAVRPVAVRPRRRDQHGAPEGLAVVQ